MVSVGLDKKLYTYDLGAKKPVHTVPFDAPFSSVAFKDDGQTVAAGTNSGRVVFYDIRGKPQPFTVLRAYSSSEVRHGFPCRACGCVGHAYVQMKRYYCDVFVFGHVLSFGVRERKDLI